MIQIIPRYLMPFGFQGEGNLPKVPRSTSPASPIPRVTEDEIERKAVGHDKVSLPVQEMDELDAAEAAQFKADVQGHRQQEVRFTTVQGAFSSMWFVTQLSLDLFEDLYQRAGQRFSQPTLQPMIP